MSYSTTKVFKMKRQILKFCEKISKGESRPNQKFVADICYGALASQSCLLSSISHCLHEKTPKRRTVERLARHLNKGISDIQRKNYLDMISKWLPSEPVIHVDNSDVTKPYGRGFEDLCMVRDGSKSTAEKTVLEKGYSVTEAVVLTKSKHPVSVYSKIWSSVSKDFISENCYTEDVIDRCVEQFGKAVFVMDRGYDENAIYNKLSKCGQEFVIRVKMNRNVTVKEKTCSVAALCNTHKGKICAQFRYHGKKHDAKISCIKGYLTSAKIKVSIIIVYGLSDHPLVLATNKEIRNRQDIIRTARLYFNRWRIEEYFRAKKDIFDFENFRVRSLSEINSLNFYLSVCMTFLGFLTDKAGTNSVYRDALDAAKPIKEKVSFVYYRLAFGIHEILSKGYTGILDYFKPLRTNQRQCRIRGFAAC